MKVDVTTPNDDLEPEAEKATTSKKHVGRHAAAADDVPEAEYEAPEEETKSSKSASSDGIFSMADIEEAQAEAQAANDRYLRLQAEWDNFRKRTAREREDERERASEALVTKLLPVVDDIELSLDHAAKIKLEGAFAEFVDGVSAMHEKFVDILTRAGVEVIDPAGQPFDMNEDQAVAHVEDPTLPANTVRDVYQKGYRMGGHIIRPATVTVSKGGPESSADAAGDEQSATADGASSHAEPDADDD